MSDNTNKSNLNRRRFVKWAGIAGVGLSGVGTASASGSSKDVDCQVALWGARCRQISVRCEKTYTVKGYMDGNLIFKKTKKGGGHFRKSLEEGYCSKVKVYHKGELVGEKACEHDHTDVDCKVALWGARCRQISVRCEKTYTVKGYRGDELIFKKTKKGGGHFRKSLEKGYCDTVKVYHKGKLVGMKICGHAHEEEELNCQVALWGARCRQISVRCNKTYTVKGYRGDERIFKKTKKGGGHFRKSLEKGYCSKVEVYHKGKLVGEKTCGHDHEQPEKPKQPDCDVQFHKNCRRVTVSCSEKVTVKAHTKKEHKWGGKVIEKKTANFDWTVGKHNYFTKVKVYYDDELIAEKRCSREGGGNDDEDHGRRKKRRRKKKHRRGDDDEDKKKTKRVLSWLK